MNKDEVIKDKEQMARIIAFELCLQKYHKEWYGEEAKCYADNNFSDCIKIKEVVDKLYNEGYHKIKDDETVIKKDEYMDFLRTRLNEIKLHSEFLDGFSQGYKQAKQETASEILQTIQKVYGNNDGLVLWLTTTYDIGVEDQHE